jgi:hypothetical protein
MTQLMPTGGNRRSWRRGFGFRPQVEELEPRTVPSTLPMATGLGPTLGIVVTAPPINPGNTSLGPTDPGTGTVGTAPAPGAPPTGGGIGDSGPTSGGDPGTGTDPGTPPDGSVPPPSDGGAGTGDPGAGTVPPGGVIPPTGGVPTPPVLTEPDG